MPRYSRQVRAGYPATRRGARAPRSWNSGRQLNLPLLLLPADTGETTTLPAGRHEFPFSFQLPP